MQKRKAIKNIHQLQENFHKYKMEVKEKANFLGWLKIIIKQLKRMNNKKIDDSTIITKVLYNLLNNLKHIKSTSNSVPKGPRKDLDLLTL
jgi:hypothetical protein